jgi:hypothetical protein
VGAAIEAWLGPLIVALTALAGWVFTDWRKRAEERRLRRAKVLDIQKAIRAEIEAHLHQLRRDDLAAYGVAMTAAIRAGGDGTTAFVPLLARERHDTVFQALVGDIHLLSTATVRPVTLYYNQIVNTAEMAETIRSAPYAAINAERRAQVYGDFIDMKITALRLGENALAALNAEIEALEAPRPLLSIRGADLSGPGSGA